MVVSAPSGDARLERRHEVVGLLRGLARGEGLDLALRLRLDVLEQALAVGVLEGLRVELRERVVQEPVRVLALVLGAEVVGLVEEDWVDVAGADEVLDLDEPPLLSRRRVELLLLK